jgi:hypothetical protein
MTFASLMEERLGGSKRYDSVLPVLEEPNPPNPPNPAPGAAARLLEACALNCRLLIMK